LAEYQAVIEAPFGLPGCRIGIRVMRQALVGIDYLFSAVEPVDPVTPCATAVVNQLNAYFDSAGHHFTLPVELRGTPFQRRVWRALAAIPCGATRSYGLLAAELGTSARAVGNACRVNPVPVVIPCHRVTSASSIGGYAGETEGANISIKRWLLAHETEQG